MGKPRVIAETGAGQHGVATATAARCSAWSASSTWATEDVRRQKQRRPNGLLGAEVVPSTPAARTLKEASATPSATGCAMSSDTHYVIGSRCRPGTRFRYGARPPARDRRRGARAVLERGRAAGRRHRLRRRRLQRGRDVPSVHRRRGRRALGVEAGGEGLERGATARRSAGSTGCAARLASATSSRTRTARPRGALGLRRARLSRRRARTRLLARHRPRRLRRVSDRQALAAFNRSLPAGGHHPRARSHPCIAWLWLTASRRRRTVDLVCLSGRGDKDLAEVIERGGGDPPGDSPDWRRDAPSSAHPVPGQASKGGEADRSGLSRPLRDEGRAALMPYMMAGFPDHATSLAIASCLCRCRRRPDRARRSVLGPSCRRADDSRRGNHRPGRRAQPWRPHWRSAWRPGPGCRSFSWATRT